MNSAAEHIGKVIGILTAILSEQEELAYEIVLESDPVELFSAITGVTLSLINSLSEIYGITVEEYIKDLAMQTLSNE
jgi:hypothetical protein